MLDIELSTSILKFVCRRRFEGFVGSENEMFLVSLKPRQSFSQARDFSSSLFAFCSSHFIHAK